MDNGIFDAQQLAQFKTVLYANPVRPHAEDSKATM